MLDGTTPAPRGLEGGSAEPSVLKANKGVGIIGHPRVRLISRLWSQSVNKLGLSTVRRAALLQSVFSVAVPAVEPDPTSYPCVSAETQHIMTYANAGRSGEASGSTYRTVGCPTQGENERAPLLRKVSPPTALEPKIFENRIHKLALGLVAAQAKFLKGALTGGQTPQIHP